MTLAIPVTHSKVQHETSKEKPIRNKITVICQRGATESVNSETVEEKNKRKTYEARTEQPTRTAYKG